MNDEKCLPKRDKYWLEINDSEKIERMRNEVKILQNIVKKQTNFINKLLKHSHNNNQILTPLNEDDEYETRHRNPDYF